MQPDRIQIQIQPNSIQANSPQPNSPISDPASKAADSPSDATRGAQGTQDIPPDGRSRRWFLRLGAAWSAALVARRSMVSAPPEPRSLGATVSPYGSRSRFEKATRFFNTNISGILGADEVLDRTTLRRVKMP